jgi:hypothetical protein
MKEFRDALGTNEWLEERLQIRAFLEEHHDAAMQIQLVRDFYEEVLANG